MNELKTIVNLRVFRVCLVAGLLVSGCSESETDSVSGLLEADSVNRVQAGDGMDAGGSERIDASGASERDQDTTGSESQENAEDSLTDGSQNDPQDSESGVEDVSEAVGSDALEGEVVDSGDPDAALPQDSEPSGADGVAEEGPCGSFPKFEWPAQSGVVYMASYYTEQLRWYRTDGLYPILAGTLNLGGYSHDTALDPVHDLLAVAHDIQKEVSVLKLDRPENAEDTVESPELVATLDLGSYTPRFLVFDAIRNRLLVFSNAPVGEELLDAMWLHIYDMTDPGAPVLLGDAFETPVTSTVAVDPFAGLLGLIDQTSQQLRLYNIQGDIPFSLGGAPISLKSLYPQSNGTGFQARGLTFDPVHGRILAARAQTALSEVIAFSYPSIYKSDEECPGLFLMDAVQMIPDGFDVDQEPADWDNLLGGYGVHPVPGMDATVFVADAWNGTAAKAAVFPLDQTLSPGPGCGEYGGSGCFLKGYFQGNAVGYERTDGAACVDGTHKVVVGTSYSSLNEEEPGGAHFFRLTDDLVMTAWLPENGGNITSPPLTIGAECH